MRSKSTKAAILPGKKLDRGLSQLSSDRTNQSVNNVHTRTRLRPRRRPYKKRKRDLQRKNSQEKKETILPRRQQPAAASCGDILFFFARPPSSSSDSASDLLNSFQSRPRLMLVPGRGVSASAAAHVFLFFSLPCFSPFTFYSMLGLLVHGQREMAIGIDTSPLISFQGSPLPRNLQKWDRKHWSLQFCYWPHIS